MNVLPNGHLLMMDNGNERPAPDGGVLAVAFSRALEYSLDTTNTQATIVWQYQETPELFTPFVGNAQLLPNGNVLVCFGGLMDNVASTVSDPTNLKWARIVEVTHDAVPAKVADFDIRQELDSVPSVPAFSGYTVYRATRIPSLY